MTVGELVKALEGVPTNMEVLVGDTETTQAETVQLFSVMTAKIGKLPPEWQEVPNDPCLIIGWGEPK